MSKQQEGTLVIGALLLSLLCPPFVALLLLLAIVWAIREGGRW